MQSLAKQWSTPGNELTSFLMRQRGNLQHDPSKRLGSRPSAFKEGTVTVPSVLAGSLATAAAGVGTAATVADVADIALADV